MATSRRSSGIRGIGCGYIVAAHGHDGQRTGMTGGMPCGIGSCVAGSMTGYSLMRARGRRVDGQGERRSM
jgi:hypothetical protein